MPANFVTPLLITALFAPLTASAQTLAGAERSHVFTLSDPAGSSVAVFVVRDSSFFSRVGGEAGWMSPTTSCMSIAGYPAVVDRLVDLESFLRRWIADPTKHVGDAPPGVVTALTTDTATIAGIRTKRLHITTAGEFRADMWVARDILPTKIREAGDRWRELMPPDYWRRMNGGPGLTEITYSYGIPLRIRAADGKTIEATSSDSVPSWVNEVQQSCNAAKR